MQYRYGLLKGLKSIKNKAIIVAAAAGLFIGSTGLSLVFAGTAQALSPVVVYDALPSVTPQTNYPSQPFQAQQTDEFGDSIHLGGTARVLNNVTVTMSDWAEYSTYQSNPTYSGNSTYWTYPITLNVYSTHLNSNGAPDQLLATTTQNVNVPWRPAGDPSCPNTGYGAGFAWKNSEGQCVNGLAFNATFDLSSSHVTLPDNVIVSVALNTQTYGAHPTGVDGPYNSLNVAVPPNQPVSVGSDASTDSVFWNTHTCSLYTDTASAAQCSSGNTGLYQDTGWTPYGTIALQVTAMPSPTVEPSTDSQCLKGGWEQYNNPSFKNQGQCIKWVESGAFGRLTLSGPSQRINFNVANEMTNGHREGRNKNNVEYWNYGYPGGLHYDAQVTCSYVNPYTREARFMFQIPSGHPGLSGLYVVAYVKHLKERDTIYGHAATGDLETAQQWCQTGAGFTPTMYAVTNGWEFVY